MCICMERLISLTNMHDRNKSGRKQHTSVNDHPWRIETQAEVAANFWTWTLVNSLGHWLISKANCGRRVSENTFIRWAHSQARWWQWAHPNRLCEQLGGRTGCCFQQGCRVQVGNTAAAHGDTSSFCNSIFIVDTIRAVPMLRPLCSPLPSPRRPLPSGHHLTVACVRGLCLYVACLTFSPSSFLYNIHAWPCSLKSYTW